jgi:HAD superfamily hydrolase (TIGR01509 family)
MDKKFAIFDMDGTLVDSMVYWKNLAAEFLTAKGISDIPGDIYEKIKPMTISESAELFVNEFLLEGTAESIASEMNNMMNEHYRKDIPLKEGVREYLDAISQAGTIMCIASSTAEPLMEACLSRLGVLGYFQFLLSCETVGAGKNRPNVYYEASKRMGCCPAETAVYEDAFYAISTARKAGFYVVGVYDESANEYWKEIESLADETICTF